MSDTNLPDPATTQPLDPNARPRPVRRLTLGDAALFGMTGLSCATACGAFLVLASGALSPARGATRSCQLEWQQRQSQIREAIDRERAEAADHRSEARG
jgi:hypothetical protein